MDLDFINLCRGLAAAVILKAIEDYRRAVAYLYKYSGQPKLTFDQQRRLYESVRTISECECAISDMSSSILGYDSSQFMETLKQELYNHYENK